MPQGQESSSAQHSCPHSLGLKSSCLDRFAFRCPLVKYPSLYSGYKPQILVGRLGSF